MNKRLTALVLVLALSLSVGMVSALADEKITSAEEQPAEKNGLLILAPTQNQATADVLLEEPVTPAEESTGTVILFEDLETLVRKNSPTYGALTAQIGYVEETREYVEQQQENLEKLTAKIAELSADPNTDPAMLMKLQAQQMQLQTLVSSYASVAQQDTTQMEVGCHQIIMGCQTLYITMVGLELQEDALVRQLAALDRTVEEMKIRQEMGQVSELQMMELESGRTSLANGIETLRMNLANCRMQLEQMIGEKITGTVCVSALPKVVAEQINAIDVEKDLKTVLRKNPDVQAANDADDALRAMGKAGMSEAMWDALDDANDYTLKNAKQQAEIKFRSLYAQVKNDYQAIGAAQEALEVKQLAYDAAALKYEQGSISKNVLLTAKDELQTAKEAVTTAENTAFATYNQYNWAVKHGILN